MLPWHGPASEYILGSQPQLVWEVPATCWSQRKSRTQPAGQATLKGLQDYPDSGNAHDSRGGFCMAQRARGGGSGGMTALG